MTPQLSNLWEWAAPAVANHLWQSTIFAFAAGLLALALRKNQARARYWLWLAASMKFLMPFSLLIAIGSHLTTPRAPTGMQPGYYYATEIGQPFAQFTTQMIAPAASSAHHLSVAHVLPVVLPLVWMCGFVAVLGLWLARWRRIAAVVRAAVPLDEGREADALRRMECACGMRRPIRLLLSPGELEPGIFGIFRPVLLWPEGISAHLSDAQLDAILAHELRHVRHRDNLAAAMHTAVQAIFWFYPLVWWLGAQMVREREHGCDEEVVGMGGAPGVYAEGILKACEFCVASPLASFSGVTGANLKQRIIRIMTGGVGNKLSPSRKLVLIALGTVAFAGPLIFGLVNLPHVRAQLLQPPSGPLPSFEVASVKPSRPNDHERHLMVMPGKFTVENMQLKEVIKFAYGFSSDDELVGAPSWISSDKFDIDAKESDAVAGELERLPRGQQRGDQIRFMVQSLLEDRFKLKVSRETKELPVYALVVAKSGPKLIPDSPQQRGRSGTSWSGGALTGIAAPMPLLVQILSSEPELGGRVVLDETGLKEKYDWTLKWTPERMVSAPNGADSSQQGAANEPQPDSSGPTLFTALEEQLGLKLQAQKGPVEVLVVDHVEKPTEN